MVIKQAVSLGFQMFLWILHFSYFKIFENKIKISKTQTVKASETYIFTVTRTISDTKQRSGFESVHKLETCSHCHIVSATQHAQRSEFTAVCVNITSISIALYSWR